MVIWLAGGRGTWLGVVWLVWPAVRGSEWVFRPGGSGGCPWGCPPWGPVPWFHVLWRSSSGACAVACVMALAVAGVVTWRSGCHDGLRGVLGGSGGCTPFSLWGCTFLPLCRVRWPVGATWCGSCGARSVLRRRVLAGVCLEGSCGVDWGWVGAGPSVVACLSCVCALGRVRGGLVGAGWVAGADLLAGVQHMHPLSPSRSPNPPQPAAELPQGGGIPPDEAGGGQGGGGLRARGPGVALAGAGGGGCVWAARGTASAVLFVGGEGCEHGTALAGVAAPGGAGAAVAGAGGGGCLWVARGTRSAVLFVGGGKRGHGTVVACVAAPGGAEAVVAGAAGGGRVSVARGTGSAVLFVGGGGRGHGTRLACVAAPGGA